MIVVSGPPGAGKSTVARATARRLGGAALDLDELLEEKLGTTVGTFIRERGEAAFRDAEAAMLRSCDADAPVLALGGGTLVSKDGCLAARRLGPIFGLQLESAALDERLRGDETDRPLLAPTTQLLRDRRETYASVDRRVAGDRPPDDIAAELVDSIRGLRLVLAQVGEHETRVLVGRELATAIRGAVAAQRPTRPVVVVADAGVPLATRTRVIEAIASLYPVVTLEVPGGEPTKSWSSLERAIEDAIAGGAGRQSVVVGIGGGATTDLAGLVAHLLGRGAPLVLVPTTVLAQVDAAVGGKCAINTSSGRNLVGAFHPATDVLVDLDLLESLDAQQTRCGVAEMLKIAIIADGALFDRLAAHGGPDLDAVARCVALKAAIVARDPFEGGERKHLNLGHTLAHALESASDHTLPHGEAVAIGICAAARYSHAQGHASEAVVQRIVQGVERTGLPTFAPDDLLARAVPYFGRDKKSGSTHIDFIAVQGLEKVRTLALPLDQVRRELIRYGGRP